MSATLALQQCPLVRITLGKNVFLQCEIRTNLTQKISGYLTIIPRARMGYESIAHEAEGQMGY